MTIPLTPSPAVCPKVQLTARQRACLEQIARRQTSPQRLVRRAKILLALETGANQCHVTRHMRLHRGTVHTWRQRWLVLAPKLEQIEADGGPDTALTTIIVEALTDHPRAGTPATFTAAQMVQIGAVACEDPADSGRPVSPGRPREVAEEVRKRGMVETISTRSGGRFFTSGGLAAPSGRVLAQRQAGCPRGLYRPRGCRVCSVSAGARRGPGRRPWHQDGGEDREPSAGACRPHLADAARSGRAPCVGISPPWDAVLDRPLRRGAGGRRGADQRAQQNGRRLCGAYRPHPCHRSRGPVALYRRSTQHA